MLHLIEHFIYKFYKVKHFKFNTTLFIDPKSLHFSNFYILFLSFFILINLSSLSHSKKEIPSNESYLLGSEPSISSAEKKLKLPQKNNDKTPSIISGQFLLPVENRIPQSKTNDSKNKTAEDKNDTTKNNINNIHDFLPTNPNKNIILNLNEEPKSEFLKYRDPEGHFIDKLSITNSTNNKKTTPKIIINKAIPVDKNDTDIIKSKNLNFIKAINKLPELNTENITFNESQNNSSNIYLYEDNQRFITNIKKTSKEKKLKSFNNKIKYLVSKKQKNQYIYDPNKILSQADLANYNKILKYHAIDSDIDVYILVTNSDSFIPSYSDFLNIHNSILKGKPIIIACFKYQQPQESVITSGIIMQTFLGEEYLQNTFNKVLSSAKSKKNHLQQLKRFIIELTFNTYWLEVSFKKTEFGSKFFSSNPGEQKSNAKLNKLAKSFDTFINNDDYIFINKKMLTILLTLAFIIALSVILIMVYYKKSKNLILLPPLPEQKRLQAPYAGGTGATLNFGSPVFQDNMFNYDSRVKKFN